ncbi:MAG: PQQ-binding-like beta-propeller repeat protein [Solirubrobacterales bacterium]|nr:PQQ-binding-like beta-propeller repeat protein [Solirubrobacterales bacterium]
MTAFTLLSHGRVAVLATLAACLLWTGGPLTANAGAEAAWTTYHHDAARSGADPDATNPVPPSFAWQSVDLGAPLWNQPLILGSRVYVATVGNEIYALDAATGAVIWSKSAGVPVPEAEVTCGNVKPTVGVVGTPVIDPATQTLYAVAEVWDAATKEAHHLLRGFKLSDGEDVLSTPVDPPGSNPKTLLERPALNLSQGKVIFGYGGNAGDCGLYNGAVVAAPEAGGAPSFWSYHPAAPAYGGAAVWGPGGPAVDEEGHIYIATGNPNFPEGKAVSTYDYSDSLLELSSSMALLGNFEPPSWLSDSNEDRDLGSSGPELLPGHVLFQAGKNELGYLIDETTMGSGAPALYSHKVCKGIKEGEGEGSFGGDAYAAGTIYVPCTDGVRALSYDQVAHTFTELWQGPTDATGPPIVSGGLVWVISGKFLHGGGTKLYGLDPATGVPRYTETLPSPTIDHFASPSAAGGRVFVATGSSVTAYQIADLARNPPTPSVVTGAPGATTQTTASLQSSVNPNGGEVSNCTFFYGMTSAYGEQAPCDSLPGAGTSPVAVTGSLAGLTPNTTYHFNLTAVNEGGEGEGADATFKTLPNAPAVVSGSATAVTQTTASLSATVNPMGAEIEECVFEYGPTSAYGASAPCSSLLASEEAPSAVTVALAGLQAHAVYHFRTFARGPGGSSQGSDESFATLPRAPVAVTGTASSLTQGSATLNATVDPGGVALDDCHFDYGSTVAYGSAVPCTMLLAGGLGAQPVSAPVTGLSAGTSYFFRIAAANVGGAGYGEAQSVSTPAPTTLLVEAPGPQQGPPGKQGLLTFQEQRPRFVQASITTRALRAAPDGRIGLALSCPGGQSRCVGSVLLRTAVAVRLGKARPAVLSLAGGSFAIAAGQRVTVSLRLSARAWSLVKRGRLLRVRAILSARDAEGSLHSSQALLTLQRRAPTSR